MLLFVCVVGFVLNRVYCLLFVGVVCVLVRKRMFVICFWLMVDCS